MKFKKKIENIEGSDGKKAKDSQFIAWQNVSHGNYIKRYTTGRRIIKLVICITNYDPMSLQKKVQTRKTLNADTFHAVLGFSLKDLDSVRLRYGLPLKILLNNCDCSKSYNVQHAISCQKGQFVT